MAVTRLGVYLFCFFSEIVDGTFDDVKSDLVSVLKSVMYNTTKAVIPRPDAKKKILIFFFICLSPGSGK